MGSRCAQGMRQDVSAATKDVDQLVTKELIQQIGDSRFELWFSDSDSIRIADGALRVSAPDEFSLDRLRAQFNDELLNAAKAILGQAASVQFDVVESSNDLDRTDSVEAVATSPATIAFPGGNANGPHAAAHSTAASPSTSGPARPALSEFEFGAENPIARTVVEKVVMAPGQITPLVFFGPVGCGKSHLLHAVTQRLRRQRQVRRSVCITAEQFTSHFIEALNGRGLPVFRRKYRELDLFAIDDVHFFSGKRATLIEFQYTIDELLRAGKQVLVGSEKNPAELGFLEPELVNRLNSGMVCELFYPGKRSRLAILKRLCRDRQLNLPAEILNRVATRLTRDVRQLSGAVNRLHVVALSQGDLSLQQIDSVLDDLYLANEAVMTFATITDAVCEVCGVLPDDLKSNKRTKRISTARMLAMWLSREYTGCALSEIGQFYGGRSHSTVISAKKKVEQWIGSDQPVPITSSSGFSVQDALRRIQSDLQVG